MCVCVHTRICVGSQTRVEDLTASADRLAGTYPDYANVIDEQQSAMTVSWEELNSRTLQRRERLSDSLELYHFLSDVVGLVREGMYCMLLMTVVWPKTST